MSKKLIDWTKPLRRTHPNDKHPFLYIGKDSKGKFVCESPKYNSLCRFDEYGWADGFHLCENVPEKQKVWVHVYKDRNSGKLTVSLYSNLTPDEVKAHCKDIDYIHHQEIEVEV